MVEKIYDTIRGILYSALPKNAKNEVVVYDRPIKNWLIGDRDVVPSDTAVMLSGTTVNAKDVAFNIRELEYRITLTVFASADNQETSERLSLEMARIIHAVLLSHYRMWVIDLCPICGKFALSPEHLTIDHTALLAPYVTAAENALDDLWEETHDVSVAAPTPPASGVAADAFLRLYEDVRNDVVVTGLSTKARSNIKAMQRDLIEPIRLLYSVVMTDVKPSDDGKGQQLLHTAQFTISARELVKYPSFGPDNVPTTAV